MTSDSMFKFVTMFNGWESLALITFAVVLALCIAYNS